jgi:hypothetical protein
MTYDRRACDTYLAAFHPGFPLPDCEELLRGALEEIDRLQVENVLLKRSCEVGDDR